MSPSPNLKLKAEDMTLIRATFNCLSAHNASAVAAIIPIIPQKASWNLSKLWNVISFTATADTLHVQVPVARIVTGKIFFHVHFNTLINSQIYKTVEKRGETFKQLGCLHFCI